ncbi:MAG: ATP-binding cassette domain-containing protein [Chelatococcus sp.]|uniref:ABC transporter ATP-binding protein n=1 Tax=Chelatococcus sp. TaxID=1953771 RepID=UPI0025C70B4A|nr:ATP-binding cassette domain-containing protein [Chelatococcus sp.]MBX3536521.1 ATP-binding cassette domain-containing protein [Chelatococcus sp.]
MLELRGLSKHYKVADRDVVALADVDLVLPPGSFTVVVGRSGCGKSTLLRLLAGLVAPTAGDIRHADGHRPTIGCVFQEPRLMPWLSVTGNAGFGLVGKVPKAEIASRVAAALALVGLTEFRDAYPDQLSGGMASRVGLARALVLEPELLLLDEPFAALDAFTRRGLQAELTDIWLARRPTVVFVTHDVEEALLLADQVVHMDKGRIIGRRPVPLPRPRDATDQALVTMRRAILDDLAGDPSPVTARHPSLDPSVFQQETIP